MLGLFSAKPDHPFADTREAERALNDFPAQDPAQALDSATAWLESLAATTGFKPDRRLELILQIDQAVLPQTRRLGRDYLTTQRLSRVQEYKWWQLSRGYWEELVRNYEDLLRRYQAQEKGADGLKTQLPLIHARLLHAYGNRLKWDQFRYGPIESGIWLAAGGLYLAAAQSKQAQKPVALYPGGSAETTVEREYLKLLLFQASSMDNLLPVEIEIAERLITHLLPSFSLTAEHAPENVYWVDLAKPLPPTRLAKLPEITATLRFFATRSGLAALASLQRSVETAGALPAAINFGGQYSPRVVLPVLEHLATCWAPKPPMRSHARHRVKSRLAVVAGLSSLFQRLAGASSEVDDTEAWVVEDVSQGGMGALVPMAGKDWLKVGALVGLQPEGGKNWLVAVVRRLTRETDHSCGVGLETLSKQPRRIIGDSRGLQTEAVLLDPIALDADVRLVVAVNAWEERIPLALSLDGANLRLHPQAVVETGGDYLIGRYRVRPA
jgi:hypothetical protein